MGGNALKNTFTRRYNLDEYILIQEKVLKIISNYFSRASAIPYVSSKQSFGDLDVIVDSESAITKLTPSDIILSEFHPNEIIKNDTCYSFDYEQFQIDIIFSSADHFQSSLDYYSNNDVSILVGRIFNKFGLKYGNKGLVYPMRNQFQFEDAQIILSKDPIKIMKFIGIDYKNNFQSFNDIYEYVISSPYFDSRIFSYEEMNHQNRTRNRKRVVYAGFLDYLKVNNIQREYNFLKPSSEYIPILNAYFDIDMYAIIKEYQNKYDKAKIIHNLFNGTHLLSLGYKSNRLGFVLEKYKRSKENFEEFVVSVGDTNLIIEDFKKFESTIVDEINNFNLKLEIKNE